MMRGVWAFSIIALLTACGADGDPVQPKPEDGKQAVTVTGDAQIGMTVSQSGTRAHGSVALNRGPLTLSLGF